MIMGRKGSVGRGEKERDGEEAAKTEVRTRAMCPKSSESLKTSREVSAFKFYFRKIIKEKEQKTS